MLKYKNNINFTIEFLHNQNTLNIFSDASMRARGVNILDSCYGSVAVHKDTIIDEMFRISSDSTVPAAELRGIRCSISLALRYRYNYPIINIFSDSQVGLFGLRNYIYGWKFKADEHFYNKSDKPVKNEGLFVECYQMLETLKQTNRVNLFHQAGHVGEKLPDLKYGIKVFRQSNNVASMDYSSIRYISLYNNYVDSKSRSFIRGVNVYEVKYKDPIVFYPSPDIANNIANKKKF